MATTNNPAPRKVTPVPAAKNTAAEQQQVTDGQVAAGATPATGASSANVNGVALSDPGGSSGSDVYSLGTAVAGAPTTLNGLPADIALEVLADYGRTHAGKPPPAEGMSAQDLMHALTNLTDPNAITYLQHALFYSHQYTGSPTISDVSSGVMDDKTVSALKNIVTTTAQSGAGFGDYLTKAANFGRATNDIATAAGGPLTQVVHPSAITTNAALRDQAQQLLGHDLSPSDYLAFQSFYDNLYSQAQKSVNLAQAKAEQKQQVDAGVFGTPTDLAGAYNILGTPTPPEPGGLPTDRNVPLSARDNLATSAQAANIPLSARDTALSAEQDKRAAYNQLSAARPAAQAYADAVQANAGSGANTFDTTQAPSAGEAAGQFIQNRYGQEISQVSALNTYSLLLKAMGGK